MVNGANPRGHPALSPESRGTERLLRFAAAFPWCGVFTIRHAQLPRHIHRCQPPALPDKLALVERASTPPPRTVVTLDDSQIWEDC